MAEKTIVALYDHFNDAKAAVGEIINAGAHADRIALLYEGNVLIEGSFQDLEKSDNKFVLAFMKRVS